MTDQPNPDASIEPVDLVTPVHASMTRIVRVGMAVWAVALVVTLVVPPLHQGDKAWWPWCCVAGIVLGAIGLFYLGRGRGNAAEA